MGASVSIEPQVVVATPGVPTVVQVRLRNTGGVIDEFTIDVVGDAAPWSTVEPSTVSLFPATEDVTSLTFLAPRASAVRAGTSVFGVRVRSKEDPGGSSVEEGTIQVEPFTEVSTELVPHTSRGSTGATHDLAIDNRGNTAVSAAISATDPDRLLSFDVRPPAVNPEAGAAAFSKIRVAPRHRFLRGPSVNRPFRVDVAIPGHEPVSIDGALLQTSLLPPWTLRALMMAGGLLVALVLAWAFLLKPAIDSTARQQAEDVLAAVGITIPPSGGAPGPSGGASPSSPVTPSQSPGTTGSPPPTASPLVPAGGATPADGRLSAGDTAKPDPGKGLYITDLVFSNPATAAVGQIRLERDGTTLLALELANFRDLDFHFVTPILVADGQVLSLVCPNAGCPGAAVYYSGFQR